MEWIAMEEARFSVDSKEDQDGGARGKHRPLLRARSYCSPRHSDISPRYSGSVSSAFSTGSIGKKALFLDYDGTLREFVLVPSDAVPTPEMQDLFRALRDCEDIDVHIVSGRDAAFLDEHFSPYGFTLVAEHGYRVRAAGGDWQLAVQDDATSWKPTVREVMERYAQQVPGTHVEEKLSALVWHYRAAETLGTTPETVWAQADNLLVALRELCAELPVEVSQGQKIVEAASSLVNKGQAVRRLGAGYDKVLCVGDDKTDENMFRVLAEDAMPGAVSIKVGSGVYPDGLVSEAQYVVDSPETFRDFLKKISRS